MSIIGNLIQKAKVIRRATQQGENTAERVGGLLVDITEYLDTLPSEQTVDSELSLSSENPVQNKVITQALSEKQDIILDLDTIRDGANKGNSAIQEHQSLKTINGMSIAGTGNIDIPQGEKGETGPKGADGTTPHIDSATGCWFVGDVSTGVLARGEKGEQGEKGEKGDKGEFATVDTSLSTISTNPVQNKIVTSELDKKQPALISGTNIKTINSQSILGSGNIEIQGGGNVDVDSDLSDTSENPVQNKIVTHALKNGVDKNYNASAYSGLGKKNLILSNGSNILPQNAFNKSNTIYRIQYDFDLNGQTFNIPDGCVLKFDGGTLTNGTLVGNDTEIKAGFEKIFGDNLTLDGTFTAKESYPQWFGIVPDNQNLDATPAVKKLTAVRLPVSFSEGYWYLSECLLQGTGIVLKGVGTHYKGPRGGSIFRPFYPNNTQRFILKLGGREDFKSPGDYNQVYQDIWCSNFNLSGIFFDTRNASFVNADSTGAAQNYAAVCFDWCVEGFVDIRTEGACPGVFIANSWEIYFENITLYGSYTSLGESALYIGKAYTSYNASNVSAVTIDNLYAETIFGKVIDCHEEANICSLIIKNIEFEPADMNNPQISNVGDPAFTLIKNNVRTLDISYYFTFTGHGISVDSIMYCGNAVTLNNDTIARGLIYLKGYGARAAVGTINHSDDSYVIDIFGGDGYTKLCIDNISSGDYLNKNAAYTITGEVTDLSTVYAGLEGQRTAFINIKHTDMVVDADLVKVYRPGLVFNSHNIGEVTALCAWNDNSEQAVVKVDNTTTPMVYFRGMTLARKFKFESGATVVFNYTAPNQWDTENIIVTYYKNGSTVHTDKINLEYSETKILSYRYSVYSVAYDYCRIKFNSGVCIESVYVETANTADTVYDSNLGKSQAAVNSETNISLSSKADKATSLDGYGITDAYTRTRTNTLISNAKTEVTGGSSKTIAQLDSSITGLTNSISTVDNKLETLKSGSNTTIPGLEASVYAERNRALAAETLLQQQYNALTQSDKVIGELPSSGTKDVIYRVPGGSSYSDYMWNGTSFVRMATYSDASDNKPEPESTNLAKSGGIYSRISEGSGLAWIRNGSGGNPGNTSIVTTSFVPTNGNHNFLIEIGRPNLPGYKYRIGYILTSSTNDLYKTTQIQSLSGYVYHADTNTDTSTTKEHIINFKSTVTVGLACQIDEVSEADSSIVNPLRVSDFNGYSIKILPYNGAKIYVYTNTRKPEFIVEEGLYAQSSDYNIYIHNSWLAFRSTEMQFNKDFTNNAALAAELGVSLVTSPSGAENCIKIEDTYCMVLDRVTTKVCIKHRYNVTETDYMIINCLGGRALDLAESLIGCVHYALERKVNAMSSTVEGLVAVNSLTSAYRNGSGGNPSNSYVVTTVFIPCKKGTATIKISRPNVSGYRYLFGYVLTSSLEDIGTTRTIGQMAGYITHRDSDADSALKTNEISITSDACVGIALQIREAFEDDIYTYRTTSASEYNGYYVHLDYSSGSEESSVDLSKADEFNILYQNAQGSVESFVFFSDPHYFQSYSDIGSTPDAVPSINRMLAHYKNTATDFVLCGGDWLTAHKQSIAVKALGKIDGWMNKTFKEFYPVMGNHDNNYQGELDGTSDTSANDGILSTQKMVNLWFRKYGKAYYSFNGSNTKFYVFDSGTDWDTSMFSYRWEQVNWFGSQLQANNDANIVIVTHIASVNDTQFTQSTPMADNLTQIAQAYNSRSSISLNGQTYSFNGKTGKVRCLLCGHVHADHYKMLNNIPMYCITTAMDGTFDLMLLDYGAGKLKTVRVGTGSNREMNLVV